MGLPGAGKTTFTKIAKEKGFFPIVMGDFVRKEAKKRGLPLNSESLGWLMFKLREEMGNDFLAKLTVEAIKKTENPLIIVDGIRTPSEVELFREKLKNFKLIVIHASRENRFKRITKRKRSDDTKSWEKFMEREKREIMVGLEDAMMLADLSIQNNGSLDEFRQKIEDVLRRIVSNV
ncbi:MAG: AAA family ATPase [Candidatus Bathyarchaeota archaeon]|nr:AAA family ATPase [Candidatus Bathyarchaeota archaeon]